MMAYEILVFPKEKKDTLLTATVLHSKIQCPCDRCTHTLISPRLLDVLRGWEEDGIKFQIVRGFICQMNWLARYNCTSGNKCLQGLAIHVKVHEEDKVDLPAGIKSTKVVPGVLELAVVTGDLDYVSRLGKTGAD